jgi:hypothetical protein
MCGATTGRPYQTILATTYARANRLASCRSKSDTHAHGNAYYYANIDSDPYSGAFGNSYADTCSTKPSEQSQRIGGFQLSNQSTLDR